SGLDVFEKEPIDPNHPLLQMKHVVTTPHIGSSTRATERKMSELAAFNLEEGLNGRKPPHLLDPAVWHTIQTHRRYDQYAEVNVEIRQVTIAAPFPLLLQVSRSL